MRWDSVFPFDPVDTVPCFLVSLSPSIPPQVRRSAHGPQRAEMGRDCAGAEPPQTPPGPTRLPALLGDAGQVMLKLDRRFNTIDSHTEYMVYISKHVHCALIFFFLPSLKSCVCVDRYMVKHKSHLRFWIHFLIIDKITCWFAWIQPAALLVRHSTTYMGGRETRSELIRFVFHADVCKKKNHLGEEIKLFRSIFFSMIFHFFWDSFSFFFFISLCCKMDKCGDSPLLRLIKQLPFVKVFTVDSISFQDLQLACSSKVQHKGVP